MNTPGFLPLTLLTALRVEGLHKVAARHYGLGEDVTAEKVASFLGRRLGQRMAEEQQIREGLLALQHVFDK